MKILRLVSQLGALPPPERLGMGQIPSGMFGVAVHVRGLSSRYQRINAPVRRGPCSGAENSGES